jgi:transposase InsO family protein
MVPNGRGKREKAILRAFIDDATRRIVYSQFSFTERSLVFEQGLQHILAIHGRIGRVYVDNGATFVSSQTKRILDILQVLLIIRGRQDSRGEAKLSAFSAPFGIPFSGRWKPIRSKALRISTPGFTHGLKASITVPLTGV